MTRSYQFGAVGAVLLLTTMPARSQDHDLRNVEATPPTISFIQTGGYWQSGKQDGLYRVVVTSGGFEHVASRLYVQWIATDQDRREHKTVRTVEIKDIGYAVAISPAARLVGSKTALIELSITRRDGKRERRVVTLHPDGRYSYK